MARAALQMGVRDLAAAAKVSPATIVRFEASCEPKECTVDAIGAALEAAGVEFIAENGGGAGVRLRKSPPAQSDASLANQIASKETAIAEMPEYEEPSPEAGMATMDKALAQNESVDLKNKRTRRKNASWK